MDARQGSGETSAGHAAATSVILVDVPSESYPRIKRVHLIAPTSTDERIVLAAGQTDGWLYVVSVTGTTGARSELSSQLATLVERTRRLVNGIPRYAGFGIGTPKQARRAAEHCDGVVVGSRAVQVAEAGQVALREYVASLRSVLDAT